jgi:hypothetical protein
MSALLGLGAGTVLCGNALGSGAWRAYEAVEEAWIRDRHALVLELCPGCSGAAVIDLEVKLLELQRRGLQFEYLSKHRPEQLRGGMWQLSWLPMTAPDRVKMLANPQYRKCEERIQRLTEDLRKEAHYEQFRTAQTRLWKTPEYRSVHRRYSGRLQELNRVYSGSVSGSP